MAWRSRVWEQVGGNDVMEVRVRHAFRCSRYAGSERKNKLAVDQNLPGWETDFRLFQGARIIWEARPFS